PRQGPARRALPHPARRARHPGRQEPQAAPLEVRSKTTQVIGSFCGVSPGERSETRDLEKVERRDGWPGPPGTKYPGAGHDEGTKDVDGRDESGRREEWKRATMSRRHSAEKRDILPDPKFGNVVVTKFMNSIMHAGKKSVAEHIV